MVKEFKTRTGAIFCDTDRNIEWLYVGDYGKEHNLKANFLGLTKEINSVSHKDVNLSEKMVVTISTQKGCAMHCQFCDCPKVKFGGNVSREELVYQVEQAIASSKCEATERFNLHLARMGEPALNHRNVFDFIKHDLRNIVSSRMGANVIHPVFTTMMPKCVGKNGMAAIIEEWCKIKNEDYNGEAGLQLSINSTSNKQRDNLFDGLSLPLEDIAQIATYLPRPKGRKYTLNFPVTADTIIDPKHLTYLFDKTMFLVKITPIHETTEAKARGIVTKGGYEQYDVYRKFEDPLLREGWDVIVFVPSKEEDADRITCGNALLSTIGE